MPKTQSTPFTDSFKKNKTKKKPQNFSSQTEPDTPLKKKIDKKVNLGTHLTHPLPPPPNLETITTPFLFLQHRDPDNNPAPEDALLLLFPLSSSPSSSPSSTLAPALDRDNNTLLDICPQVPRVFDSIVVLVLLLLLLFLLLVREWGCGCFSCSRRSCRS